MKQLTLDEQKQRLVVILDYVTTFCEKNDIKYSLDGGTLLGAVRHKGFIPWDDDIDIALLRPEYEKFLKLFLESPNPYFRIHKYDIDNYPIPFIKIGDNRTLLFERGKEFMPQIGVNIDIFPYDHVSSDLRIEEQIKRKNRKDFKKIWITQGKISKKNSLLKKLGLIYHKIPYLFTNPLQICKEIEERSYNNDYSNSGLIFDTIMALNGHYEEKWVNDYVDIEFEGKMYRAFSEHKKILEVLYGDYMTLPDKEHQHTHGNIVYIK